MSILTPTAAAAARQPMSYDGDMMLIGKSGEQIVTAHLESKGYIVADVSLEKSYQKRSIDLLAQKGEKKFSAEVKTDNWCSPSGNLFFETHRIWHNAEDAFQTGWPWRCEATWLIIVNTKAKEMYVISPNDFRRKLKEFVAAEGKNTPMRIVESDDQKTTFGILLPFSFCADCISMVKL